MGYLLETLGRGLLGQLADAFTAQFPPDQADALAEIEQRAAVSPTSFDLAHRLGVAALRAERLAMAQNAFERAAGLNPQHPQPLIGMACVDDAADRLDDAIRCLELASERDLNDPAIRFGVGLCHERAGRATEAHVEYRAALRLCPRLRNAQERLAALAVVRRDWATAAAAYEALATLEPDDLDVLLTLGALRLAGGRPCEAAEVFQRALLIEPETGEEALRADALAGDGALDEAIQTLANAVRQYPGVTEFRVQLGDLYVKAGRDQLAVAEYQAALDLQPNFLEAAVKLGTQHLRGRRYADAASLFGRAMLLNDRLLLAFVGLGVAQADNGQPADADATFDLALGLAPNSTLLFSEAARLNLKARHAGRAPTEAEVATECIDPHLSRVLEHCERTVERHPDDAAAAYRLALLRSYREDAPGSLAALRRALMIDPVHPQALLKLGVGLRELGDDDGALAAFRAVFQPVPAAIEPHYSLALVFARRRRFEAALDGLEGAAGAVPQARARIMLALEHTGVLDRCDAVRATMTELAGEQPATTILTSDRKLGPLEA